MKKIIYYTLIRPTFMARNRYEVLGVTSTGPRRRINGRYMDGASTHTIERLCIGKFNKAEDAQSKIDEIYKINFRFDAEQKQYQDALDIIWRERQEAIDTVCKSCEP